MPKIRELGITALPEAFGPVEIGGGGGCSDCTQQAFSICGTTPGGGCSDCTFQAFSICGTTPGVGTCSDCTRQAFSICGTTPGPGTICTDCTQKPFSICGGTRVPQACVIGTIDFPHCGGTRFCGGTHVCGGSVVDPIGPRITPEAIATVKRDLQNRLAQLEEQEKALGPQTLEEIDRREQELSAELERIRGIRKDLKK